MVDAATPNLPSRDFAATSRFFARLGFVERWRDEGWMILGRGGLVLEFFSHPDLDPAASAFSYCLRLDDVGAFYDAVLAAGIPEAATGCPRAQLPKPEPWGGTVGR